MNPAPFWFTIEVEMYVLSLEKENMSEAAFDLSFASFPLLA
jgi:hypothetical protein